ncbi:MAG: hypothetical protein Q4D77_06970 [Peptostreptococcaceae bacterium]|nr:hypothetical protein [Peptostreptococcaceae bacterium]
MKKILIIINEKGEKSQGYQDLINEYVEMKKAQGYVIELIGDLNGVLKKLLEEEELWGTQISSAQAEVMFQLNRYEFVIYVPNTVSSLKDMLVYDPNKLDKNMIFYNIGNMSIVESLDKESQNAIVSTENFSEERIECAPCENMDSAESVSHNELLLNSETQGWGSDFMTDEKDGSTEEKGEIESEEDCLDGQLSQNDSCEIDDSILGLSNDQTVSDDDKTTDQQVPAQEAEDQFGTDRDRIEPTDPSVENEDIQDEEIIASMNDISYDITDEDGGVSAESSLIDRTISYFDGVSSDQLTVISEEGTLTTLENSHNTVLKDECPAQESPENQVTQTNETESEIKIEPRRPSIIRRLWLLCPWIIMGLMTILKYEKIAWLPFIIAVIGLFMSLISKRSRRLSKTPEWLCIFLALIALIVNIAHPAWIIAIGLPISIMAIVLFIIAGFVIWDN